MSKPEKKIKPKRAKGKSLQEFMQEGNPTISSQTTKIVTPSWADDVEEEEGRPQQIFALPTAPRASRVFDTVPENAPYTAYLSKLPYDAGREDIEEFFCDLNITEIKLPREDDNSTKNRGFAYVEFAKREDLIAAISIPDPSMLNRRFKIDLPNEEQGKRGGGGGRGRYDNFGSNVDENSTNWRKDVREDNDGGGMSRRGGGGYGGGGGGGYNNRDRQQRDASPETGNWRDKQRPRSDSPPPDRYPKGRGGYNQDRENNDFRRDGDRGDRGERGGDRGGDRYPRRNNPSNGYEDRTNRGEADAEAPRERPKLNLAPRTLPMPELKVEEEEVKKEEEEEEVAKVEEEVEPPRPKPTPVPAATIFGSAKPVDTAAKEREIEERMEKQRAQEEERVRERNENGSAEESNEKEPEVVVNDNQVNSWRRRDNDRSNDDAPRTQSPNRRRYSPDRRGGGRRDDRRGGGGGGRDRDYDNYHRRDNRDRDNRDNRDSRDNNRDHRNRDQRDQRVDRNRGDNFNRGGGGGNNRNEITRSRDDKEKPARRDKSAGDPKDIDRMPKYQAPVKPKLQMSNKYEDLLDEDGSD